MRNVPGMEATWRRPDPPAELTDDEADVWLSVVSVMAADWFTPETQPLLEQYCRHVCAARYVAQMIKKASEDPDTTLKKFSALLKIQREESKAISSLATKMRLTHQATRPKMGTQKPTAELKPWEE